MATSEPRVDAKVLEQFTREVFTRVGLPPEDAAVEAEVLVWANLRGVDSHGVLRLPWYIELVDAGHMNPTPRIRVARETAATVLIDADRAFGPVVTTQAMRRVIEKARGVGVGWGLIRDTTHQGAMGYYSSMAANAGMAGIAIVCSPPNMAPHGARAAGVHNSPIALSVPAHGRPPLTIDIATSIAAGGKLRLAVDKGVPIPEGWALDGVGQPTTDPKLATILLPMGGYKGSGLAMLFECLSSLMVGNPLIEPALAGAEGARRHRQNSIVAAIDIAAFTDPEAYRYKVDQLIERVKALPRADGVEEILVPGEPEQRVHDDRVRHGIPLPPGTVQALRKIGARFQVPVPPGL